MEKPEIMVKHTKAGRVSAALHKLGMIDKKHDAGKISKKEHDKRSRKVLFGVVK